MFILFSFFLSLSVVLPTVAAFTFIPGTPSECDNLPLSWTGGTPPFQLLLTPVFGTPQNISIPTSAFNNGSGFFSMLLQMQATSQFLLTMSDATGFNSGGTTSLLTVGASIGGSSCNTTNPAIAFSFELNSALIQCIPFVFSGYADAGAVQPVTIAAFIPGGTAFQLNPPVGSTSFSWIANVIHGTSMIFSMTDALGGQGGSSDIRVVGLSDDSSCLDNSSPSSTPSAPSPTASTPSSSNPASGPPTAPPHGTSIAAIAGTVIASLVFLAVIITLGLFFFKKKFDSQTSGNVKRLPVTLESEIDLSLGSSQTPVVTPYNVPQSYDRPYSSNANPGPSSDADPFQDPSSQPVTHSQMPSQYYRPGTFQSTSQHYPLVSGYTPQNPVTDSSALSLSRTELEPIPPQSTPSTSTSQRKAAMASVKSNQPSRFIVHTDADDDLPQPNDDGVIELPPQYSERRKLEVANPTPDSDAGHPPGNFHSS